MTKLQPCEIGGHSIADYKHCYWSNGLFGCCKFVNPLEKKYYVICVFPPKVLTIISIKCIKLWMIVLCQYCSNCLICAMKYIMHNCRVQYLAFLAPKLHNTQHMLYWQKHWCRVIFLFLNGLSGHGDKFAALDDSFELFGHRMLHKIFSLKKNNIYYEWQIKLETSSGWYL